MSSMHSTAHLYEEIKYLSLNTIHLERLICNKGRENKYGNDEGGEGFFCHFSHGANMTCPLFISAIRNSNSIRYKCSEMHPFQGYYFHIKMKK